jgi:hypothetical protein
MRSIPGSGSDLSLRIPPPQLMRTRTHTGFGTFGLCPDLSAVVQDDEGGRGKRTQPGVLTPGTRPYGDPPCLSAVVRG